MYRELFIKVVRDWEARHGLVGVFVTSKTDHTEAAVILDNKGSAYQVMPGLPEGPFGICKITITEYVPHTMKVLNRVRWTTTIWRLGRRLDSAYEFVSIWIAQKNGERLSRVAEDAEVQRMFKKGEHSLSVAVPGCGVRHP